MDFATLANSLLVVAVVATKVVDERNPDKRHKNSKEFPDILIDEFKMIYEGNQLCDTMAYDELNKK